MVGERHWRTAQPLRPCDWNYACSHSAAAQISLTLEDIRYNCMRGKQSHNISSDFLHRAVRPQTTFMLERFLCQKAYLLLCLCPAPRWSDKFHGKSRFGNLFVKAMIETPVCLLLSAVTTSPSPILHAAGRKPTSAVITDRLPVVNLTGRIDYGHC